MPPNAGWVINNFLKTVHFMDIQNMTNVFLLYKEDILIHTSIAWRVDLSHFWLQQGEVKCKHLKWELFIVLLSGQMWSENPPFNQKVWESLVLLALLNNIIHHLSVHKDTGLWPGCWRVGTNGKQHLTVNSWCLSTLLCVEAIWGM